MNNKNKSSLVSLFFKALFSKRRPKTVKKTSIKDTGFESLYGYETRSATMHLFNPNM